EVAAWFNNWSNEVERKKAALEEYGILSKRQASYLSDAIQELQEGISEAYEFYFGFDPDFTWWVEEPFKTLNDSLKSYAEFAETHFDAEKESVDESGIVGTPIGEEEINRRL
ncbi:MAG TPA: DUF885 domain-containing protein, partial [Balneolaceae bacterium]|nr:DUF885 domain-containing protein [Balneolaceae bacterium]